VLIASPFCKFAPRASRACSASPIMSRWQPRHAIYGRPGATYLDMPERHHSGANATLDQAVKVERVGETAAYGGADGETSRRR